MRTVTYVGQRAQGAQIAREPAQIPPPTRPTVTETIM